MIYEVNRLAYMVRRVDQVDQAEQKGYWSKGGKLSS